VKNLHRCLLLLLLPGILAAQSPYRLSWTTDGYVLGAGGVLTATWLLADRHLPGLTTEEISALSADNVNPFDRPATENYSPDAANASDVLVYIALASPAALFLDKHVREDFVTIGAMYGEVLALAFISPEMVKGITGRTRPFVYGSAAPEAEKTDPDARRSFFSGHTTFAFASAVFLSTVYGDYFPGSSWTPVVWAGSLSVAAAVGILRIGAGKHFATDVITGAIVGGGIGYLIPYVHRTGKRGFETSLSLLPGGASVSWSYTF
jgi:membrane-associated phospholipid phosphatase